MTDRPTIGWIGAGRMGVQLAQRLLASGYDVAIYNRTPAKAQPLVDAGATPVARPIDLAERDVVFSMVSADPALEAVLIGADGLFSGGSGPRIVADMSTVSAGVSEAMRSTAAAAGTALLAAPVSGNPAVIAAGKLTVAVSGSRSAFDEAEPVLREFGRGVTYVGEGEVARLVKIAHNVFLGVVTQSLAEITVLAQKAGVSREAFLAFLNQSVMGSLFTGYKTPAFVNLDFTPTFTMPLLQKDLDLGLDAASRLGAPMPIASATRQIVAQDVGAGNTQQDFASLLLTVARGAGLELEPEDAEVTDGLHG